MSDSGEPKETFEALETGLQALTRKLEHAEVPLESRLRLHAQAVETHRRLEAALEAARKAILESPATEEPDAAGAAAEAEPYEAVRDRLGGVVDELEREDLPLARVVELHGQARRLAARCEAILNTARKQLEEAGGSETQAAAPRDDDQDTAPF